MLNSKSSVGTRKDTRKKPAKPHPDFPLFAHQNGYWSKKVRGKLCYFGSWKTDSNGQRALGLWLDKRDDLLAGRTPRVNGDGLTVQDLVNRFLTFKQRMVASKELRQSTWNEYNTVCGVIVAQFGLNRLVSDLASDDFEALRATFAETAGPVRLGKLVQIARCVFKYGYDSGIIATSVRFGPAFVRPSKSVLRRHRADQGPKLFTAAEIRKLLKAAGPTMKAFILLGINCGAGNSDVARLQFRHLDLTADDGSGILDFPRGKTGINRRCILWSETRQAIEAASRKTPVNKDHSEFVFITKYGGLWEKETTDNPVSKEFTKLCKSVGLVRKGATFYSLRHSFRTIADECLDAPAIDFIMGHARDDMGSIYRERIADTRLLAVTNHVHSWLWPNATSDDGGEVSQ